MTIQRGFTHVPFLFAASSLCAGLLLLTGCHSAFVQATVFNQSGKPIHLFEVDYPNASFGSGQLEAGAAFHYRFKVLGDGQAKLTWTDAAEHEHASKGPALHEGLEGALTIAIGPENATWDSSLHEAH